MKLLLTDALGRDADTVARFQREARVSVRIKSEHVVRVTDADVDPGMGGVPFFVMELLDGVDLERLVQQRGPLPVKEVVEIVTQLATALGRAHSLGIVHRDLKLENLFLHRREDGTPTLKVLDFGISKLLDTSWLTNLGSATRTETVFGTPLYMAPEQSRAQSELISPATDVWAVGLVAYRLLTASFYWSARNLMDLMIEMGAQPKPAPSSRSARVPPAFDAWFACSCQRDPKARYQSVAEQVAALRAAFAVEATTELPASVSPAPSYADARVGTATLVETAPRELPIATHNPLVFSQPVSVAAPRSHRRLAAIALGASLIAAASAATWFRRPILQPEATPPSVSGSGGTALPSARPSALAPMVDSTLAPPPLGRPIEDPSAAPSLPPMPSLKPALAPPGSGRQYVADPKRHDPGKHGSSGAVTPYEPVAP